MRLGRTTAIYFISKTTGSLFGFLAMVYFARTLGETVLGQYALVLAIVMWTAVAGEIGVASAMKKRISEQQEPGQYLGGGIILLSMLSVVLTGFIFIFSSYINAYVNKSVASIVIVLFFMTLYWSLVHSSLEGNHRVHLAAPISALRLLLRACTQIVFVILGFGLIGLLWGYIIGYFIMATVGLWVLELRPAVPDRHHIVSLLKYARYAWVGGVQWRTFNGFDVAVLGLFVSQALVGVYSIAWLCGQFLNFFSRAVSETLFPAMSERSTQETSGSISELIETGISYAGLLLIPGFVGSVVIGDYLLAIFGNGFVRGHAVLVILVAALTVYAYLSQLVNTLNAIDRPDLAFRANGVLIGTNMPLNVIFIWQVGWLGAAIATAISAATAFVIAFYYVNCCVQFHFPLREIIIQWISALCMGGIVAITRIIANSEELMLSNEILVTILIGFGAVAYFCFILLFSPNFREVVIDNILNK